MVAVRASRLRGSVASAAVVALCATFAVVAMPASGASSTIRPASVPRATGSKVAGETPRPVASHAVVPLRRHDPDAVLSLNIGLAVRNSAQLDEVIRAASTPGSPAYGHYLTPAQYQAGYAPTDAEVAAVRTWLTAHGARMTGVTPDNLIVSAEASTAVSERAFGVSLDDYRDGHRVFYSNDVAPSVPADSGVQWVTGLNDFAVAHSFAQPAPTPTFRTGGYRPSDFRRAYNVNGVPLVPPGVSGDETIGLTLWGAPLEQPDLDQFASHTGSAPLTIGQAGPDGIDFVPCSVSACNSGSPSTDKTAWGETALDVETAHGVAPGSHLVYWLGSTSLVGGYHYPDVAALEHAVSAAANDPTVSVVSNSWGFDADTHDPNMDVSLQHAASVGKTFFFSSGDSASISYPATSPYAVAVGGTHLNLDGSFDYVSESAWGGSGNGCSAVFGRPSWQVGVGSAATCIGRAVPDVAADGDPGTGAYVWVNGGPHQIGGTSLSAPLWAAMTAVWNEANLQASRPSVGFAAPVLYSLANNTGTYHSDFHDVVVGAAGGNPAGAGWDEVTGWGSPNLANIVARYLHQTPTKTTLATAKNPIVVGDSVVFTATVSPTPSSGSVAFRQYGIVLHGCGGVTLSLGRARCSVLYGRAGTFRVQAGYNGNADLASSPSNTISERVVPAPPSPGYWMVGATGDVYSFGASAWHGNAKTPNVTHIEPTPSRRGYWIVNGAGQVYAFGDAPALGNASGLGAGETVSSLSSTPSGRGYWLFTSRGRALRFGDARFFGDMSGRRLNGPVIGSVATPSGLGYFMVASDGGIFSFGDAAFFGSTGGIRLNRPVNGLVATGTNRGYWLVASDGGVFAFGDASFRGSMGGTRLNRPVVGMVRYGNGYLMVGADGGIFDFSDQPFFGSLASTPLAYPIVSVAS
ncbi:MAG: hypothetical protein QOH10_344 [Actinomycetota bacterium]|nr:hypothetical protein [Actinomycetota bacterium]